jgi:hypothetical protein
MQERVARYRFRSRVTIGAMAFAGCIMIFYASLLEGWLGAMETNAVAMEMGELQMHAPGYLFDPDLYAVIPDAGAVIEQAAEAGFTASARLLGGGLAAAHENSTGVSIRGIDPCTIISGTGSGCSCRRVSRTGGEELAAAAADPGPVAGPVRRRRPPADKHVGDVLFHPQ